MNPTKPFWADLVTITKIVYGLMFCMSAWMTFKFPSNFQSTLKINLICSAVWGVIFVVGMCGPLLKSAHGVFGTTEANDEDADKGPLYLFCAWTADLKIAWNLFLKKAFKVLVVAVAIFLGFLCFPFLLEAGIGPRWMIIKVFLGPALLGLGLWVLSTLKYQ